MYSYPYTCLDRPVVLQEVQAPGISIQSAHESSKDLNPKDRQPLNAGDIPESPQGHSTARRIKSTKTSNEAIGNQTPDLNCSAATNFAIAYLLLSLVIVI